MRLDITSHNWACAGVRHPRFLRHTWCTAMEKEQEISSDRCWVWRTPTSWSWTWSSQKKHQQKQLLFPWPASFRYRYWARRRSKKAGNAYELRGEDTPSFESFGKGRRSSLSSSTRTAAGCLRIAAGKRMSVEEEAVKYCNTADADCDCCCEAASCSSSSNSSYCNCIAWRQLLHTPATARMHLPFPVSRLPVWSTLPNTSARSSGAKLILRFVEIYPT